MAFVGTPFRAPQGATAPPRTAFCPRCVRRPRPPQANARRLRMSRADGEAADAVSTRVRSELAASGVNLDDLLNAGRVVNLTRELDALSAELAAPGVTEPARAALLARQARLERALATEKRAVMGLWLKRVFLAQAILFGAVGGALAFDAAPWHTPVVGQALGFWMVWLFTIPALRARKGIRGFEKSALNVAFLAMPFVNVGLAAVTRECGAIWAADVALLVGLYVWYGVRSVGGAGAGGEKETARIRGVLRYLDWGSWR